MTTPQARSFAVTPPPVHAGWVLALFLLLPAIAVVALFLTEKTTTAQAAVGTTYVLVVLAVAAIACVFGLLRRQVLLDGPVLRIVAGLFSHEVRAAQIDLDRARIVNLDERTELRPAFKTFGMSLPGYNAGHFRLREKLGKAFCLLTDRRRVLWLPFRSGSGNMLLSLEKPQALLDALREAPACREGG